MTIPAAWMALPAANAAQAAPASVALSERSPARSARRPADARFADRARHKVAAGNLLHHHRAPRTAHRFARADEGLHLPFRAFELVVSVEPVLVLLAAHFRVDRLEERRVSESNSVLDLHYFI